MRFAIIIISATLILGAFAVLHARLRRRREAGRNEHLLLRPRLSPAEIRERYYAGTAVSERAIEIVRNSVAAAAHIPAPEVILPSDRLIDDLRPWGFDDLGTVELVMTLEKSLGIDISNGDAERLRTVGDLIRYAGGKMSG